MANLDPTEMLVQELSASAGSLLDVFLALLDASWTCSMSDSDDRAQGNVFYD